MLTVRPATPDDYALVGELTVRAYEAAMPLSDEHGYREVLRDAAGRAEVAELWVAEQDGAIVGTVTACPAGTPYAEVAVPTELEVRMLAVAPDVARRGIGRELMSAVHADASARGFTAVVLSVIDSNSVAADFYRRLSYQRRPDRDWLPLPDVPLQVWQLPLDDQERTTTAAL